MLKGKTAVVTGSTSGVGLGVARAFDHSLGAVAAFLCFDAAVQICSIGLPVGGGWTAQ